MEDRATGDYRVCMWTAAVLAIGVTVTFYRAVCPLAAVRSPTGFDQRGPPDRPISVRLAPQGCPTLRFLTPMLCAMAAKRREDMASVLRDRVMLMRHGERLDHVDKSWKGTTYLPATDPPLSRLGRQQALESGLLYLSRRVHRRVGQRIDGEITYIVSSPFHRCVETALIVNIVACRGRACIFVDPLLSDWAHPRICRTKPSLGGRFARVQRGSETGMVFRPQRDALRSGVLAFLRAAAKSIADSRGKASERCNAEHWEADAEAWMAVHEELPVWTTKEAQQHLEAEMRHYGYTNSCGVGFPEGRADVIKRASVALEARFAANSGGGVSQGFERSCVPPCITTAIKDDVLLSPSWLCGPARKKEAVQRAESSLSILPPAHVLFSTHADIVRYIVEAACPTFLDPKAGFSVPYCSITTLTRANTFYTESSAGINAALSSSHQWSVCQFASTDHLKTKVHIQFQ